MGHRDRAKARDVLERVGLAVEELALGKGNVNQRLVPAVGHLVPLRAEEFPEDLQEVFKEIMASATRLDASDLDGALPLPGGRSHNDYDGRIESTMRRIRRATAQEIARNIWRLEKDLRSIAG